MNFNLEETPVFQLLHRKTGITIEDLNKVRLEPNSSIHWDGWLLSGPARIMGDGHDNRLSMLKAVLMQKWFFSPESHAAEYEQTCDYVGEWLAKKNMSARNDLKQMDKASKERTPELNEIVRRLARSTDKKAKELWPELFAELDSEGLEPEERGEWTYRYNDPKCNEKRQQIKLGTFENRLTTARKSR